MKSIIFLFAIFLMNSGFSSTCYKDLCTGDIVRDLYGYKGEVSGFDSAKDEVIVTLEHNGYNWHFAYEGMGKLVRCQNEICISDKKVDWMGRDVIVLETYTNGHYYVYNLNVDGYFLYKYDEFQI